MEGGLGPRVCKARSRGLHFRGDLARVDEAPKGRQGRGSSCRASPRLRLAKSRVVQASVSRSISLEVTRQVAAKAFNLLFAVEGPRASISRSMSP